MQITTDTIAFVTGANRGLGRALVDALLERGVSRVYAAARTPGSLEALVANAPERVRAGALVNVLSLLSLASAPAMAGYSASKAAAHSLTQALRPTLAARGVAVHGA